MPEDSRHIYWTGMENHKVVVRIHELLREGPERDMLDLTRQAQEEVLPKERWRKLIGSYSVQKISRLVREHVHAQVGAAETNPESLRHELQAAIEGVVRRVVKDELLLMEQRLFKRLEPKPLLKPVEAPAFVQPREATKLARVLILGLLPEQQQTIMRRFGSRMEFRFMTSTMMTSSNVAGRLDTLSESCDATFGMIRFMRHGAEDHINRKHYVRVTGSTSNLEVELDKYLKELEDAKNRKTA